MFTNKPDFMIGNSYGKFIQRDTLYKGEEFEVPLIRIGFPILRPSPFASHDDIGL
jgi:nitrogenase molybdenum-iron protein beta chain